MSDVSVIGCGAMGSALIETLAGANNRVTIWNRTQEKAETLAGPLITVAEAVGDALAASPLTIVCVADHDIARTLVDGAVENLHGRAVVCTSFAVAPVPSDGGQRAAGSKDLRGPWPPVGVVRSDRSQAP